jgi:four helix bundle protein
MEQRAAVRSYRDLLVWQKGMDLVEECYRFTWLLPRAEQFGLVSQIQRASASLPANIAEGYGRHNTGDFLRHLAIANGSLKELETHLLLAQRLHQKDPQGLLARTDELGRMLTAMMRTLRSRKRL